MLGATKPSVIYVMVKESNVFGKLSKEELDEFEKANNKPLPGSYRNFLLTYNGGEPIRQRNGIPPTVVSYILGMHNGDFFASLYKHIDLFNKRLPYDTFPIASDSFGNLFIMSLHPDNYGQIFFWDHELEPEFQDGHQTENISYVAYSFESFLKNLMDN